jgi:hypothetical protein
MFWEINLKPDDEEKPGNQSRVDKGMHPVLFTVLAALHELL